MDRNTLKYTIVGFFMLGTLGSMAQEFVVNDSQGRLAKIDINGCVDSYIANIGSFTDIASHPDGNYYAINNNGQLFRIDLSSGVIQVTQFEGSFYYALTCSADGTLFAASANGDLASFNPESNLKIKYENLGVGASGDLTYYKGQLYLATLNNTIISVHPENPLLNTVKIDFTSSNAEIFGIVSTVLDCEIVSYAISGDANSRIFRIGWEEGSFNEVCNASIQIYGGSSEFEFLGSEDVLYIEEIKRSSEACSDKEINIEIIGAGIGNNIEYSIDGAVFSSSGIFNNLEEGIYNVYLRDEFGCEIQEEIEINGGLLSVELLKTNPSTCEQDNGTARFEISSKADEYEIIYTGEAILNGKLITGLSEGEHGIRVEDSDGCIQELVFNIEGIRNPYIEELEIIGTSCGNDNGIVNIKVFGEPVSYTLNGMSQPSGIFENLSRGAYILEIRDIRNCVIDTSFEIMNNENCKVFVPNVFSPNDDGINDFLEIYSDVPREVERFEIFDRWGNKIFQRTNFSIGVGEWIWDGLWKGNNLTEGIYSYQLRLKSDQLDFYITGDIMLIR